MKFWLPTAALLAAVALAAGAFSYLCTHDHASSAAARQGDTLRWLRAEYHLDEAQAERILAMHEAYSGVCSRHCEEIRSSREALDRLVASRAGAAEIDAARRHIDEVDRLCRTSTEAHVRQVAAVMGDRQGARYLEAVLPRLAASDHQGAPALDVAAPSHQPGHVHP